MLALGELPGGLHYSQAYGVSADGSIVVGTTSSERAFNGEAVRWVNGQIQPLSANPGPFSSVATAVSADGSVVVGRQSFSATLDEAFVWDESNGLRSLRLVLTGLGLDVTGWSLFEARGVSADGRTIVGYGTNPHGQTEAWVAVVPEPTLSASATLISLLNVRRRRRA